MLPPPPVSADQIGYLGRAPWPGSGNTISKGKGRLISGSSSGGPRVSTPGQFANMINIPDFFHNLHTLKPGYQEAHQMYDDMRNFFARQAYATNNVELVNLKATMMWMKPGNKNPSVVSVSAIIPLT
jgi:hypothetical protein